MPEHRQGPVARLGSGVLETLARLGQIGLLLVEAVGAIALTRRDMARIGAALLRIGTESLPMGALLSIFIGMVLVVQAADQLREVSQSVLGPIVGLAMVKEIGPVMMGFLLAGRAGSAIAAELGSMAVYDEISALRTMDIDPVRFLVMPRLIASTIALPVLTLYADFIGVWGGAAVVAIDPAIKLSVEEYFARMLEWVDFGDFAVGLLKSSVFGVIVAIVPCAFGLRTRGGAAGIAATTTAAVVWSFLLILVFDFLIVRLGFTIT